MSLVNVRCINCNELFEVTRQAAQENFAGFGDEGDVRNGANPQAPEIHYVWQVTPDHGEVCPRCACAAMRLAINMMEKDLPALMKGSHLSTNTGPVDNLWDS